MTVLALALATGVATGPSAFAHGGGGGGHGGGGHSGGGHHSGGHHSGGYHHGGYHHGGYYHSGHTGFYNGYYPGYYFNSGYGTGYIYPYYTSAYTYNYPNYTYDNSVYAASAPIQGRYLGIDEQPVIDSSGPGMKVMRVYPGSPAEQAGLQPGDVILSANGYLTQQHGNISWIISAVPPNGVLQMNVHAANDGALQSLSARLP